MRTTLVLLAVTVIQVRAADSTSRVWIEGSSNIAGWSCKAIAFDAAVDSTASRVSVRLSARDLKCGNGRMDRDLYEALKATDPVVPSYIVASFEAVGSVEGQARGTLSLVGIERTVEANVTAERVGGGLVRARGSVPLRMTDFGVKPPVGLFGLIRSRDEVVVRFDLLIRPGESGP